MDQGPLHRLLREHPRTINQKLRQTVLEELIENGYPHLMFDTDAVELLGPSQKRNRLRNVVFGHPVDKVNILSPLNYILGWYFWSLQILHDHTGWYVTFRHQDAAFYAAERINRDLPIVSVHAPPIVPGINSKVVSPTPAESLKDAHQWQSFSSSPRNFTTNADIEAVAKKQFSSSQYLTTRPAQANLPANNIPLVISNDILGKIVAFEFPCLLS